MKKENNKTAAASGEALPTDSVYEEKSKAKKSGKLLPPVKELPDFKVSGCFTSHMVVQRDMPVDIWGFSNRPGMKVTGVWGKETAEGKVNKEGKFVLTFAARKVCRRPSKIIISCEAGTTELSDVLVGDVWLIGGQSNAECTLAPCIRCTPELEEKISPKDNFRLFRQSQAGAFACEEFRERPAWDIIYPEWQWKRPDREAALDFSAMGYYFAKTITELIDIPLGLIMMCPGGACIRELMPRELALKCGYETGANMPIGGYYNTMISPFVGLHFKGQMFFQGESEGIWKEMALSYDKDLAEFVKDQRERFGIDFPFYNVQLSSYRDEGGAFFPHLQWVRARQERAGWIIPGYHFTVCRDLGALPGDPDWAHSPHKAELGRRLAYQIWAYEYLDEESRASLDFGKIDSPSPVLLSPVPGSDGKLSAIDVIFPEESVLKTLDGKDFVTGFSFGTEEGIVCKAEATVTSPNCVTVCIPPEAAEKGYTQLFYGMEPRAYIEEANLGIESSLPIPCFTRELLRKDYKIKENGADASVVPTPKSVICGKSQVKYPLTITNNDKYAKEIAVFASYADKIGQKYEILTENAGTVSIRDIAGLENGAYVLKIDAEGIIIGASDSLGVNHAFASLLQLSGEEYLPVCVISDFPDAEYRGMMVDLARRWHDFDIVLSYVDMCYFYKASVLHLHFTDDQSYTLPSKIYPLLSTPGNSYTEEQINELCEYANARGIELMPEIDVPGHNSSFSKGYGKIFGEKSVICQTRESIDAMKALFRELCAMFPYSKRIHIGGDEARISQWVEWPECRKFAQSIGIDPDGPDAAQMLYANFVNEMGSAVLECGRTPVAWEGFSKKVNHMVSREIQIFSWENFYQVTPDLLDAGFTIINGSWSPMYVVTNRVCWTPEEVYNWTIYTWRPVHGGSPYIKTGYVSAPDPRIIGGQLLAWGDGLVDDPDARGGALKERSLLLERIPCLSQNTWNVTARPSYEEFAPVAEKAGKILEKIL